MKNGAVAPAIKEFMQPILSLPFNKKVEGAMEIGEHPLAYGENKYI